MSINQLTFESLVSKLNNIRTRLKRIQGDYKMQLTFQKELIGYLDTMEQQILVLEKEIRDLKGDEK